MKIYKLVEVKIDRYDDTADSEINRLLEEGWKLYGSPTVSVGNIYCQVVTYEKPKES